MMATACGTPGYVAPEILCGGTYSEKVDLWSLGVITYILLCGFPPFYDENNAVLFAQIKSGAFDFPSPYWDCVSDDAKDLVLKLLVVDATRRYSASDVQRHPWVTRGAVGSGAVSLSGAQGKLKEYNGRRKLRAHILAMRAVLAFSRFGKMSLADRMSATAEEASKEGDAADGEGGGEAGAYD